LSGRPELFEDPPGLEELNRFPKLGILFAFSFLHGDLRWLSGRSFILRWRSLILSFVL
jgi:hypothetical protein